MANRISFICGTFSTIVAHEHDISIIKLANTLEVIRNATDIGVKTLTQ